jgi:hypothetical protein
MPPDVAVAALPFRIAFNDLWAMLSEVDAQNTEAQPLGMEIH